MDQPTGAAARPRRRPTAYRDEHGKTCPRCETHKPWDEYALCRSAADEHQSYCKPCSVDLANITEERNKVARQARRAERATLWVRENATKKCTKCGEVKSHIDFYVHRATADGRSNHCRACSAEYQRQRRIGRDEEIKAYNAARDADPVRRAKARRTRKRNWLMKYGLTPEMFDQLLAAQDHVCAICGLPGQTFYQRNLHVDHDHETCEVRGLLCGSCNWALGAFKDDADRLRRAVEYLTNPPMRRIKVE